MDALFQQIEDWHGDVPWGQLLDAGTGKNSLQWITALATKSWTAVTGDIYLAGTLQREFSVDMRVNDRFVFGNWLNHEFLKGECYNTILVDYLLGAIDGFAPYFQDQLFERLAPLLHPTGRLYFIGLEPFNDRTSSPGGKIINQICQIRNACILLAGHRCYREYPQAWVKRKLQQAGFQIEKSCAFPIRFGPRYINGQLDVALAKLNFIASDSLVSELKKAIEELRKTALLFHEKNGPIQFSFDYVISAYLQGVTSVTV